MSLDNIKSAIIGLLVAIFIVIVGASVFLLISFFVAIATIGNFLSNMVLLA